MESERHKETYVVDTASSSMSRILTITDGSGTTTLCIYGQGLICEKTGDIYRYHHYNNLGSTMKLTDAKGGVTASFTYGTYGELLSGSTGFTRFLYNGRCGVITDDNGFYYMRQRYYSPELKRFVNQDVIRGSLGNSQSLNRYSYVQGNPISYTDPFGLSPLNGLFTGTTLWHGILGLLGCIPGPIGAAANFVDGFIYLSQKDYFGAALCFVNSVTLGTTALAAKLIDAGKLCKVTTTALRVAMVSERIGGALTFAKNFYNIGQTSIQMYCKYGILGESLGLDTAGEVLSIGLSVVGCIKGLQAMGSTSKGLLELQEGLRSKGGKTSNPSALKYNGDGTWTSNQGIIYGQGSKDGNRVRHVLQHTQPNPTKPVHTVFNVDKSEVIGLIDEAWVNKGSGVLQSNGNVLYDVNMGRVIGTNGEDIIRIVTKGYSNNIVTAFPKGVN